VEGEGGADRDVEWLPPGPAGEPPRFDPSAPDPLPPAPAPPPLKERGQSPSVHPPPAWQQTPSAPWPQAYGKPPGNPQAIWSLILGIGGLVAFVFPAGFGLVFVFNLPASVAAWVLGVQGRRRVDSGRAHEHAGRARAGLILGIVGVVIGVLAIVGWALAIALSDEVRDELRRSIEDG
jgi:hypothetical protein